jgi:Mrp family chromosome partitioning ATPase
MDDGAELRLPAVSASALAAVRASLVSYGLGSRYRTVTLLSPEPGQGSVVAAGGIGWACATIGLRAIVVDAAGLDESDRVLPVPGARGLFEVLSGSARLTDVLVPTSLQGLRILPPGRSRGHALDVLSAHDPRPLMEQLTQNADVVIVRSPAVSSGGDAVTWMSASDAIVLVVRAGACKPIMAERASQVARSLNVALLGTILMDADPHDGTIDVAVFSKRPGWAPSDKAVEGNGGKPSTPEKPRPSSVPSSAPRQASSHVRSDRRRHK